jgi:signal transduction histidine kinase
MEETLSILLVDDDIVDRMAVRRALTKAGVRMELSEVENCENAIAAINDNSYDCVFLDYHLPDQDGLTLIKKIRRAKIKVPLVVLTDQGDEQIAVELMKAGATDYLSKSRVSAEILAQVLRNAIRVYRAEMQVAFADRHIRETNEELIRKNYELEKQRQQIQLQNLKLLEVSRLKTQFLATISHELRTPLNAIIGFSQLLMRPKTGELTLGQKDMVQRILNNGKSLLVLLNEVLDFSNLEAGEMQLKPGIFDLSKIVNATVAEMRSLAEAKKLTVLVQNQLQNPMLYNDSFRVRQIITNLLSNAIKFTESGSIWVDIKEIGQNQVAIAIRDTGIGIAAEDLNQILEAFRQVDQTTTRKYAGTGLGLAIIDSLVQMMDGKIIIESQLGHGSMFRIEIPRQISLSNKDENPTEPKLSSQDNQNSQYPPQSKTSLRYRNQKL